MDIELITQKPTVDVRPTPVLFVHGMWHAAWCWEERFLPYFVQHGYESHALSLRGHGASEGRERLRWTSLASFVSDVGQVVEQLGRPPVLVGHSMGGMIVQKYLESRQVPAAVLLGSAPPKGLIPATLRVARRHPLAFLKVNLTFSMIHTIGTPELYREAFFSAGMSGEQLAAYYGRVQDESYRAYLDMMVLNLPRPEKVNTPLLVLGAADDNLISSGEVEATARAYDTRAEFFPDVGHAMMLDVGWQAVADRILGWLSEQGL
jgi:pimeloyl-ACP methyl ester carboxylesterase